MTVLTSDKVFRKDRWFEQIGYRPHIGQELVHYQAARHRVLVNGRRWGKTLVGGHEAETQAFVKNFLGEPKHGWIIGPEYCTTDDVEILTERGWLNCDELRVGDVALTLNARGLSEWSEVEAVNIFEGHREMISLEARGHSSLTTVDHRWYVRYTRGDGAHLGWRFTTTADLKTNEKVLCAAPLEDLPIERKWSDELVEMVAWYYTEGHHRGGDFGISIAQSMEANPDKVARMRACMTRLLGPASETLRDGAKRAAPAWRPNDRGGIYINSQGAKIITEHAPGPDKIVSWDFVHSLTAAQLELFIDVSIMADGHDRGVEGKGRSISQKVLGRLESVQLAAQLAGYRTTINKNKKSGTWRLTIHRRAELAIGHITQHRVEHVGRVWCPTTSTGTWLARRNGTVYFTGNTDCEKEFRIVYDLFKKLDVDKVSTRFLNNVENGSMVIKTKWGFTLECRSAKHPDSLVGEGLDFVLLVEAGRHKRKMWGDYVRPALSDKRGWSLASGVPEGATENSLLYSLYQRGQDPTKRSWWSISMPSWTNTIVFPGGRNDAEILEAEDDLTEDEFKRQYGAEFVDSVGRVMKEWDDDVHIGDFEYDRKMELYAAVDYGYTNDWVWLWIQIDVWKNVYVIGEHRFQLRDTEDISRREFKEHPLVVAKKLQAIYGPPAEPDDNNVLQRTVGVTVRNNTGGEIKNRLALIRSALKPRPFHLPDDHPEKLPALRVDRSCTKLIWEMREGYRWPENRSDARNDSEIPLDKDNHGPEALGRFYKGHMEKFEATRRARQSRIKVRQR